MSAIEPSARPRLEEERAETRRRWAMSARLARAARSLRSRQEYLVLERDLARPTPKLDPDPALELRLATADDVDGVVEIFGPRRRERNAAELRRRIEAGYLCLGAFRDGHWAGIDYVTSSRHRHGFLNLVVSPRDGHAYAFGLHEDPRLRGMGVGLRLLAASIDLSRERGDRKQFTIVQRDNERMLSASIQIFGFEVVGRLACDRIAVSARTTGEVHGTPLKGRVLYL